MAGDVAQLRAAQARVERDADRAEPGGAVERGQRGDADRQQDADRVALRDAERGQRAGELERRVGELLERAPDAAEDSASCPATARRPGRRGRPGSSRRYTARVDSSGGGRAR